MAEEVCLAEVTVQLQERNVHPKPAGEDSGQGRPGHGPGSQPLTTQGIFFPPWALALLAALRGDSTSPYSYPASQPVISHSTPVLAPCTNKPCMEWREYGRRQDPSLSPLSLLLSSRSHNTTHSLGTSCAPDAALSALHALSSVSPNSVLGTVILCPFQQRKLWFREVEEGLWKSHTVSKEVIELGFKSGTGCYPKSRQTLNKH